MAGYLIESAQRGPLVVGLDFAFSFPRWFLRERLGTQSAAQSWELAAAHGERWLADCAPPFWGRPQKPRPPADDHRPGLRQTELDTPYPIKSVFQIGGAGAVGTGSIRGMPLLAQLKRAGFRIWPFDAALPGAPLAVEIYPRILTGRVVKSDAQARAAHAERIEGLTPELRDRVEASEDAFDAALSALVMARHTQELIALEQPPQPYRSEGAVWRPGWRAGAWPAE